MDVQQALARAEKLCKIAKAPVEFDIKKNFLEYAQEVAHAARSIPPRFRPKWIGEWATDWKRLHDDFEEQYTRDPMCIYRPAHSVAAAFHESKAFVRYFRSGNRCSKSQCAYAEHYFVTTGQSRWRDYPGTPNNTFTIGVNFSKYAPAVFERKFITGEKANPLSPMFPEGGKWLHKYDERKKIVWIACPPCAEEGKAKQCKHPKSTITLFSDQEGIGVLMGGQYTMGHFDEHISEDFYQEAVQRTQTVPGSCLVVTATPLYGPDAWEHRLLDAVALSGGEGNKQRPEDPNSPPLVEVFEIDQFAAGLVDHERIRMSMKMMDEFEIESRIFGRPMPLAKHSVFDRHILAKMRNLCTEPRRFRLETDVPLMEASDVTPIQLIEDDSGLLRLWEEPTPGAQYIIGVDTAAGLAGGDASCATVLKVWADSGLVKFKMVAQFHGWEDQFKYADDCFKLAIHYNSALVVVELTGGLGRAVVLRLKELAYWNIFRDIRQAEFADPGREPRFGVDTSAYSKPFMVSCLQHAVKEGLIEVPCRATIEEMAAFSQEKSDSGKTTLYRGAQGSHDDRVMSVVIAVSVAMSSPTFQIAALLADQHETQPKPAPSSDF